MIDLTQNPYFDDFNESKDYYKLLFRPGKAVQGRELTQIQSVLQNQIARFGAHIFTQGSVVRGGQTTLEVQNVYYIKIESTFNSLEVDLTKFVGKFIIDGSGLGIRAYVIAYQEATDITPKTLIVKYTSSAQVGNTTVLTLTTEDNLYSCTTYGTAPVVGNASICSIDEGTYFVSGFFAHVNPQTIVLDAYDTTPSYKVGLEITDAIVDEKSDTTLLDPAAGSSNYQAPGATRYKLSLALSKRSLTSTDDSLFVELLRVESGILTKVNKYPIYSDLENTLARRTYDESGSYTVHPFHIALKDHASYANAFNVILEPGKAYVMGYEFETLGPITVKAERARDAANVYNNLIPFDYQNWVEVTNLSGPIYMTTLTPLSIHCVTGPNVNTTSSLGAASTNMGTIRIRAMEYQSGANATSISTGVWRVYVQDANISNRIANAVTGTSNTIQLDVNASRVTDAYKGVVLRITKNAGIIVNESHRIASYNGVSQVATLETGVSFAFGTPSSATEFSFDYQFKDAEAFVMGNANVITTMMNINSTSKQAVAVDPYQGAFITDTNFNKMFFQFPYPMVADSTVVGGTPITNSEYYGRRLYQGQSFSANVLTLTTVAGITAALTGSPLSTSDAIDNVFVVIKNPGTGSLANNQVINFAASANSVTVTTTGNTSTFTITVPGAQNATADVYVKVHLPYSHTLGSLLKSKTQVLANTGNVFTSSPISLGAGITFYSQAGGANGAQIVFAANAISILQTPNRPQSVYVADGIRLAGVYDFGTNAVTQANLASATNITSNFNFDSGQRDNSYDHASIRLKSNARGPQGNCVVYVDYFNHSGLGYLTADSYISANISYTNIPFYISPTSGITYPLRDIVDFRPRRRNADLIGEFDEIVFGTSGLNFETDFSYYLSRIDKVILTKDRQFEIVKGVSDLIPTPPNDKDNAMTLYTLSMPAYTPNTAAIGVKYVDNRRYTMRDIGTLEKRISNLEYYTSLNLLEKAAQSTEVHDDTGLSRFKNGILVDPFTGHNVGDVQNPDYACSIDTQNNELRAPFIPYGLTMDLNESGSTNYSRHGNILTLPYSEVTMADQPYAALALNVNPFNTVAFIGQIKLDPSSDIWVDINQTPDVLVNLGGENDAWQLLTQQVLNANPGKIFGTVWNNWQTTWTGISNERTEIYTPGYNGWLGATGTFSWAYGNIISRDVVDVTQKQVRVGVQTTFAPETITRSIGNKVTDVSVVPYIRSRGVLFIGSMFLSNTALYPFFDDTNVQNYVNRVNIITVASNNVSYIDDYQNGETLRVYEPATGKNTATAVCIRTYNNANNSNVSIVNLGAGDDGFLANVKVISANATFLIGNKSGANTRISGYVHRSGQVKAATSNTITFQNDFLLSNTGVSNTTLIGQTVYISGGTGLGQSGVISTFNVSTGIATFSGNFTTIPDTTSSYSRGQLISDVNGEVQGVFTIPSTSTRRFRTGERVFRLIDNLNNTLSGSSTNGDVKYFAQGLLQTQNDTVISTRVPAIVRNILTNDRTVTSTVVQRETVIGQTVIGYWDPLAQTFLVDQKVHPSGVQVTGVRLIFKTKDPNVPLQIQLRPVVNGFPHSSLVIPGSDVVVNPADIIEVSEATLAGQFANSASNNPLDNSQIYTQINFYSPIYLQPGVEYAIVLIANSVKYQVYASELGKNLIGTTRLISQQPYLGSLFKSQNATLWTPVQEQDLTFRLLRANYTIANAANLEFQIAAVDIPSANVPMDLFYVMSGNLLLPNTTVDSLYTTTTSTGVREASKTFQLNQNTFFNDTLGRRVITTDPTSFKVRMLLSSQNADISPVVDIDRLGVLSIQNLINNGGLSNNSIVLANSSSTYLGSNVSVTISGGGGTGANAYAVVVANTITSIVVDQPGSGYTSSPTITISGGGGSANAYVIGEDQNAGGPAQARYITRKVTLANGMDAGDFRVYFSAYKPKEGTIDVYYKILSSDDSGLFDDKGYQLMTITDGYNNVSVNSTDIKDFVYAPGVTNIANNYVQYSGFTSFKYFAIKVVLRSTDTTKVPRIRDFRVIAFPALT